jgi:hypothetical protein
MGEIIASKHQIMRVAIFSKVELIFLLSSLVVISQQSSYEIIVLQADP